MFKMNKRMFFSEKDVLLFISSFIFIQKFSPCSKLMIGKVLAHKSYKCFEEERSSFCGNGRVEKNDMVMEECDVGGKLWGDDK